jgi:hypothetical protein
MTFANAVSKANRLAKKNEREYFVVREAGYDVVNDEDLDTFYVGISENNIVYCTSESPSSLY